MTRQLYFLVVPTECIDYYVFTNPHQAKGFEYMMTVAEKGCPHNQDLQTVAQFRIGQAYYQGYGAKQSYEKAIEWLTRAAKAGNSPGSVQAQNMLGMYYSRHESQNLKTVC